MYSVYIYIETQTGLLCDNHKESTFKFALLINCAFKRM